MTSSNGTPVSNDSCFVLSAYTWAALSATPRVCGDALTAQLNPRPTPDQRLTPASIRGTYVAARREWPSGIDVAFGLYKGSLGEEGSGPVLMGARQKRETTWAVK
jgi:hypothetical protein